MKFKSKVDWWYYLVTVAFAGACVLLTVCAFQTGKALLKAEAALFLLIFFLLILPVIFMSCCIFEKDCLRVRCGFFGNTPFVGSRIPYRDIVFVEKTRDPSSSMAPSLDRVGIEFRSGGKHNGYVMVAPKEKQRFIDELRRRNPMIFYKTGDETPGKGGGFTV